MKTSTNSKLFSKIYANNVWGTLGDPDEKFCSGTGSHNDAIAVPYMNALIQLLRNNDLRNIVDLGCGDFWIMRHVLDVLSKNGYNFFYTGIDVVENLTNYNNKRFGRDNIRFICSDAAVDEEPLPDGDILIVRQVFQHLSNADIKKNSRQGDEVQVSVRDRTHLRRARRSLQRRHARRRYNQTAAQVGHLP